MVCCQHLSVCCTSHRPLCVQSTACLPLTADVVGMGCKCSDTVQHGPVSTALIAASSEQHGRCSSSMFRALQFHVQGTAVACSGHCSSMFRALQFHVQGTAVPCSGHCSSMFRALQLHVQGTAVPCPGHCSKLNVHILVATSATTMQNMYTAGT
jgi:hypothetical protein